MSCLAGGGPEPLSVSMPRLCPGRGSRPVPQGRDLERCGGPDRGRAQGRAPVGWAQTPPSCSSSHSGAGPGRGSPVQGSQASVTRGCSGSSVQPLRAGGEGCVKCHPHKHCRGHLRPRGSLGLSLHHLLTETCKDPGGAGLSGLGSVAQGRGPTGRWHECPGHSDSEQKGAGRASGHRGGEERDS